MSRNEINLDQIQRRLGTSGSARRHYDDYDTVGIPREAPAEDESSTVSAAFLATVAAAFMVVGSGTYFYMGEGLPSLDVLGGQQAAFVSAVDPVCKPMWKAGASNDAALKCYLTVNTKRFCDDRERVHLGGVIERYRKDAAVFMAGVNSRAAKEGFAGVKKGLSFGAEVAGVMAQAHADKGKDGELSKEGKKRLKANIERLRGKIEFDPDKGGPPPGFTMGSSALAEQREIIGKARDFEAAHASKLRLLAQQGYLEEGDFGWFPDRLVKKAFAKAKPSKSDPCQGT